MKARAEACARLVKTMPAKDTVIATLARTVIHRHIDVTALDLAYKWLAQHGVGTDILDSDTTQTTRMSAYEFERTVLDGDDVKLRTHLAYAMAIAAQENQTRSSWRRWDQADADYLQLLIDKAGYQPHRMGTSPPRRHR